MVQAERERLRAASDDQEEDWHLAHAQALECDVRLIESCLQRIGSVEERFAGDELADELRQLSARLRDRRNDLADDARRLRARSAA